ncbi:MAG: hypothetical protein MI867_15735, partial [Pseudomonadales bacterium]|nr:hypothetical protein [Pseudomonadales bacterium]
PKIGTNSCTEVPNTIKVSWMQKDPLERAKRHLVIPSGQNRQIWEKKVNRSPSLKDESREGTQNEFRV